MSKVKLPPALMKLLQGSDFQSPIQCLIDRTSEILADNKLPFFPDFTDHGIGHINSVLNSEVELVPKQVWKNSSEDAERRLLCDADAAVIVGGTLLHDIAMHLRPIGFQQLVSKHSLFRPLPWFKESQDGHVGDRPWHELWDDYVREARRMSEQELSNIVGEESTKAWKFDGFPATSGEWTTNHCLVIGEFIRRHHARLAHEIAIYGFPGLPAGSGEGQFPAMGQEKGHALARLADLIGLNARSHWMSLRTCKAYLDQKYPGTPRPMSTAVLYPMALLRVADYLQIDQQRAPAVLLQLRKPQSSISAREWQKHRAIQSVTPAINPRGKMVTVAADVSLSLYLTLRELLNGLQDELDHSTAVLEEVYGTFTGLGLNQLGLATRRVYSNLELPSFRDSLPYIPSRTGFSADPSLLTLLVEPLYGKEPGVGVRELVQNSADAVCELVAWAAKNSKTLGSLDLPQQDADVLVDFVLGSEGHWTLRVQDKGIGMTSHTIQTFFLRAGASFRRSADWAKVFLDEKGKARTLRAGRFGIGAFALFLLGPTFRLSTRHVTASTGYSIAASRKSELIEIRHCGGIPVGTTIEVDLSNETVKDLGLDPHIHEFPEEAARMLGPAEKTDWFCWDWPKVVRHVTSVGKQSVLTQRYAAPLRRNTPTPEWQVIRPPGYDAVYWTFADAPRIACNGLKIADPRRESMDEGDAEFDWPDEVQLAPPRIAVIDSEGNFPLTIQRYGLSRKQLPFIDELTRDVTLSFIAHALVCGPTSRSEAISLEGGHPLRSADFRFWESVSETLSRGLHRWCTTSTQLVPADPWLYPLLGADSCVVYGLLGSAMSDGTVLQHLAECVASETAFQHHATVHWHALRQRMGGRTNNVQLYRFLSTLAREGVAALGHQVQASQVIASVTATFAFHNETGNRGPARVAWQEAPPCAGLAAAPQGRQRFSTSTGTFESRLALEPLINEFEAALEKQFEMPYIGGAIYAAQLETKSVQGKPESPLAKVWNECLGPTPIPFEPCAREALVARARQHPALALHIGSWEAMKLASAK